MFWPGGSRRPGRSQILSKGHYSLPGRNDQVAQLSRDLGPGPDNGAPAAQFPPHASSSARSLHKGLMSQIVGLLVTSTILKPGGAQKNEDFQ